MTQLFSQQFQKSHDKFQIVFASPVRVNKSNFAAVISIILKLTFRSITSWSSDIPSPCLFHMQCMSNAAGAICKLANCFFSFLQTYANHQPSIRQEKKSLIIRVDTSIFSRIFFIFYSFVKNNMLYICKNIMKT